MRYDELENVKNGLSKPKGLYHKPVTTGGKHAGTFQEFSSKPVLSADFHDGADLVCQFFHMGLF
jgi:hypothetical protein